MKSSKKFNFKKLFKNAFVLRTLLYGFALIIASSIILMTYFPDTWTLLVALVIRSIVFVKSKIWLLIAGFFLVKGKFVLILFLKKLAFLVPIGLGKRFLIEKVFLKNLKEHYLDRIPLVMFFKHIKDNFLEFSLVKKLISFLSIGFFGFLTARFFGFLIFIKVTLAKIWSVLLLATLKVWGAILYFFSQYIWNSWLTPLIEIFILSWLLKLLEKNDWIKNKLTSFYAVIGRIFSIIEDFLERVFHIPIQKMLHRLSVNTFKAMHDFIGTRGHDRFYDAIMEEKRKNGFWYKKFKESKKPSFFVAEKKKKQNYLAKRDLKRGEKKSSYQELKETRYLYQSTRYYVFVHAHVPRKFKVL